MVAGEPCFDLYERHGPASGAKSTLTNQGTITTTGSSGFGLDAHGTNTTLINSGTVTVSGPNAAGLKACVRTSTFGNDRQQHIRPLTYRKVQSVCGGEYSRRAVVWIFVGERADAFGWSVGCTDRIQVRSRICIVLPKHGETDAVASGHDDRGGPNLDVQFDKLAGDQWLNSSCE
jgi:hypothetical protein